MDIGAEAVQASELLDSGAKAVETLTEAEGTVTEVAVVIVTGQVETLAGAVTATVGQDVETAAIEQVEITGGLVTAGEITAAVERVEIAGGLVTTGEVTEAVVLGTSSEEQELVSESSISIE